MLQKYRFYITVTIQLWLLFYEILSIAQRLFNLFGLIKFILLRRAENRSKEFFRSTKYYKAANM